MLEFRAKSPHLVENPKTALNYRLFLTLVREKARVETERRVRVKLLIPRLHPGKDYSASSFYLA